jgi:hypothetical protein
MASRAGGAEKRGQSPGDAGAEMPLGARRIGAGDLSEIDDLTRNGDCPHLQMVVWFGQGRGGGERPG